MEIKFYGRPVSPKAKSVISSMVEELWSGVEFCPIPGWGCHDHRIQIRGKVPPIGTMVPTTLVGVNIRKEGTVVLLREFTTHRVVGYPLGDKLPEPPGIILDLRLVEARVDLTLVRVIGDDPYSEVVPVFQLPEEQR